MILDKIVEFKKKQVDELKSKVSIEKIKSHINNSGKKKTRDFKSSLSKNGEIAIIAEVKKASPSKGILCYDFKPLEIATEYEKNDVAAISVLTETEFFMGSDEYLISIDKNLNTPVLRKDFIIDTFQIYQSRLIGADAILLIVAILTDDELKNFYNLATNLGLHCLVEVHDEIELKRAIDCGVKIIGINNRNLNTFDVSLKTTQRLVDLIPKREDYIVVSESGIFIYEDMDYLKSVGVDAVLIGESLVKSGGITNKLKELRGK